MLFPLLIALALAIDTLATAGQIPAADFSLPDRQGQITTLNAFKNQVVLLNFWATWCAPCREELPALADLANAYRDSGLVVLAINVDHDPAMGRLFLTRVRLDSLPALFDPEAEVIDQYNPEGLHATYLIDRQGLVRYHRVGFSDGAIAQ